MQLTFVVLNAFFLHSGVVGIFPQYENTSYFQFPQVDVTPRGELQLGVLRPRVEAQLVGRLPDEDVVRQERRRGQRILPVRHRQADSQRHHLGAHRNGCYLQLNHRTCKASTYVRFLPLFKAIDDS